MKPGEGGGAALLLAFAVLALCTSVAFLAHRAVVREWAMEGEAQQGARAALAADSALAWFLGHWTAPPRLEGQEATLLPDALIAVPRAELPPGRGYRQEGEIRVRRLGPAPEDPGRDLWKVTIEARVLIPGEGRPSRVYRQVREAYVEIPGGWAGDGAGGAPLLRAWRIVR